MSSPDRRSLSPSLRRHSRSVSPSNRRRMGDDRGGRNQDDHLVTTVNGNERTIAPPVADASRGVNQKQLDNNNKIYIGAENVTYEQIVEWFSPFGSIKNYVLNAKFAFVEMGSIVESEEAIRNLDGKIINGKPTKIKFSLPRKGEPRGGGGGGHRSSYPPPSGSSVCFVCGRTGHWAKDCTAGDSKDKDRCFNCLQPGHLARECKNPKANRDVTRGFGHVARHPSERDRAYPPRDYRYPPRDDRYGDRYESDRYSGDRYGSRYPLPDRYNDRYDRYAPPPPAMRDYPDRRREPQRSRSRGRTADDTRGQYADRSAVSPYDRYGSRGGNGYDRYAEPIPDEEEMNYDSRYRHSSSRGPPVAPVPPPESRYRERSPYGTRR